MRQNIYRRNRTHWIVLVPGLVAMIFFGYLLSLSPEPTDTSHAPVIESPRETAQVDFTTP